MTLFGIIRDMEKSGQLTTQPTYDEVMGRGERFVFDGEPVKIVCFVKEAGGMYFREPHDVMLSSKGSVITYAKSRDSAE